MGGECERGLRREGVVEAVVDFVGDAADALPFRRRDQCTERLGSHHGAGRIGGGRRQETRERAGGPGGAGGGPAAGGPLPYGRFAGPPARGGAGTPTPPMPRRAGNPRRSAGAPTRPAKPTFLPPPPHPLPPPLSRRICRIGTGG